MRQKKGGDELVKPVEAGNGIEEESKGQGGKKGRTGKDT